jgi:hemolysin III
VEDRPTWRGLLHGIAFVLAVPGVVFLVLRAHHAGARAAVAVYGLCLLAGFASSTVYHRWARTERSQRVLQRLDHSSIYLVIAGSYTPVCVIALPRAWGVPILAIVWAGALLGIGLKVFGFERFKNLGYALYPILGWTAIVAMPAVYHALTGAEFSLFMAAGALYTIGIPVLMRGRPDPWPGTFGYHEVWHAFTVAAGACHFVNVGLLVR